MPRNCFIAYLNIQLDQRNPFKWRLHLFLLSALIIKFELSFIIHGRNIITPEYNIVIIMYKCCCFFGTSLFSVCYNADLNNIGHIIFFSHIIIVHVVHNDTDTVRICIQVKLHIRIWTYYMVFICIFVIFYISDYIWLNRNSILWPLLFSVINYSASSFVLSYSLVISNLSIIDLWI